MFTSILFLYNLFYPHNSFYTLYSIVIKKYYNLILNCTRIWEGAEPPTCFTSFKYARVGAP